jgi:CheY-like chemotaxis protein
MGNNRSRTWLTCRSQQRHRARDVPVASRIVAIPTALGSESGWQPTPAPHDRRHSGRVQATGTAIVHGSCAAHGRILDLGIGGLSVLVDDATAAPDVGAHVRLDVRLDGIGRWLHLVGSVLRVDARGSGAALVIELLVVPSDFEDLVQNELVSALECAQMPRILLVDGARGRRELVAAAFRAMRCDVIEVSSPLEAIAEIDQSRHHLWAVVIADTELASRADELRRFLGEMYPGVLLIVVGQRVRRQGTTNINVDDVPDLALQIGNLVSMREHLGGPA